MNPLVTFHQHAYNVTDVTEAIYKTLMSGPELEYQLPKEDFPLYNLNDDFYGFRAKTITFLSRNPHIGRKEGKHRLLNGWEAIDLAFIQVLRSIRTIRLTIPEFGYDRPDLSSFMLDMIPNLGNVDTSNWELQITAIPYGFDIMPREVGQTTNKIALGQVSINLWWLDPFIKRISA
ncbi:MAG: hypothetical protein OXH65_04140 [Paracoccaceae bacterium]|nr:hypothetical protein [Paracoccaceae bacterium]MDE2674279.1 hypothetical protein [Paracoccaceae bacterium]MDE2739445.1 hypothetical protein [Paracoccaceae bacterium]MYG10995.1 hypothetical protein [Paracoccaceae bacterium]MYJ87545.1 hypothetical protein [Paracoccaceae bacterium]